MNSLERLNKSKAKSLRAVHWLIIQKGIQPFFEILLILCIFSRQVLTHVGYD